jgi:Mg2+/Co2+ transporter CorB
MLESCLTAGLRNRGYYPDRVQLKDWLAAYLVRGRHICPVCNENGTKRRMEMKVTLNDVLPIIVFNIVHEKL